jgi:predicted phosphate transport protein (TIGR00153 family)
MEAVMLSRLLPRETSFFDFFDEHATLTVKGARELLALVSNGANVTPLALRIKEIEHEADIVTHRCVEALHKTFITPIDRNDIHRLITRMDDVLDYIEAAADRLALYELVEMTSPLKELAGVVVRATEAMEKAVRGVRDLRHVETIRQACIDVNQLENEADAILRSALASLFRTEKDPILIIKLKEIYEIFETATDRCEDVANVIEGVALEQG